jgi:hypothetical protein
MAWTALRNNFPSANFPSRVFVLPSIHLPIAAVALPLSLHALGAVRNLNPIPRLFSDQLANPQRQFQFVEAVADQVRCGLVQKRSE